MLCAGLALVTLAPYCVWTRLRRRGQSKLTVSYSRVEDSLDIGADTGDSDTGGDTQDEGDSDQENQFLIVEKL